MHVNCADVCWILSELCRHYVGRVVWLGDLERYFDTLVSWDEVSILSVGRCGVGRRERVGRADGGGSSQLV
jgi:hypothetical protein